jgi:hypothetical protein
MLLQCILSTSMCFQCMLLPPMLCLQCCNASTSNTLMSLIRFRTRTYYPMVPLAQSVTGNLMETDQERDGEVTRRRKCLRKELNQSVLCTQYLPSICPISKWWHLKSSIKVMYFVTTKNIELHQLLSLTVSLWVSTHSSSSPSAPEAISIVFACSVYTVPPPDCRHAHSLLCVCS